MSFERLSSLDAAFLELETPETPMHIAATLLFDRMPSGNHGRLPLDAIHSLVASRLDDTPRLRMRVAETPLTGHPVWVEDAHFRVDHHVRHVALPAPANRAQLRALVGSWLSQPLDRGKPLWEIWIVEGLEDGRLAAVCKVHHALMDGVGGVGVMALLLRGEPSLEVPAPRGWAPGPPPSGEALLRGDLLRRAGGALRLLDSARRGLTHPQRLAATLGESARALGELVLEAGTPASATPLEAPPGPHRHVRWLRTELAELKTVKQRLGGTVNDLVVTAVAGALRSWFSARGLDPDTLRCRAMMPVNVRRSGEAAANRFTLMSGSLPVSRRTPRDRLAAVCESTRRMKSSRVPRGADLLNEIADWTWAGLTTVAHRAATWSHAYNVVITNVPGPAVPLYALDSAMLEVYPTLPLLPNQLLSVAVFSYAGWLHWGLTADRDALPDLDEVVAAVQRELIELQKAAHA